MTRELTYVYEPSATAGSSGDRVSVNAYLRARGYSRHIMTCLRHHPDPYVLTVNGEPARTSQSLQPGDVIHVRIDDPQEEARLCPDPSVELIAADDPARGPHAVGIVYEDEDILVLDKPAYLPVQPSAGCRETTLGNAVTAYYAASDPHFVYRCVNRLDRNTSGLLIICRNRLSGAILYDDMAGRRIHRTYRAFVHGPVDPGEDARRYPQWISHPGFIEAPIARDRSSLIERRVDPSGQSASTSYRVIRNGDPALIELVLGTGRTHQIRVHMAAIGHPVAGDGLYGREEPQLIGRQALHSCALSFTHPVTREPLSFRSELPSDMARLADV